MSTAADAQERVAQLSRLHRVGLALSSERNRERLMERILLEAKELCRADGGTLYLRTDQDQLAFQIMRTDSLGIALGGTTGKPVHLPPVKLYDPETGAENHKNVASHCALTTRSSNIADAYDAAGFDFSGTKLFDEKNGYRTRSVLTIPMLNQEARVIGVLQLLNAKDAADHVVPFAPELQDIVEALAAQAAVALDNQMLVAAQRNLMEAFIKLIAAAIDAKSPYTGGHCRRVPLLTEMLARAACDAVEGPLTGFNLNEEEWYELHIAAWLHDCGKVTTPVHVMDKATKLETIHDRIEAVKARFAAMMRDREVVMLRAVAGGEDADAARAAYEADVAAMQDDLQFLEVANIGGEFMSDDKKARVRAVAARTWVDHRGEVAPVLTADEVDNLLISRGTLTEAERLEINGHMVQTILMLEALPFPKNLARVPEYAGGHHEKMDGTGYPKGLYAGDMSLPARMMAIADVFEALTAQDRPYKKGKPLSESMRIMGEMKRFNHLDPDLFDLFVTSGTYRAYAKKFLPAAQLDAVDEAALLAIEPKPVDLPPPEVRAERKRGFLEAYQALARSGVDLT
ncbi:MAG: GAF domain-containing protein [Myxococcales bacterium]|nr:GAF domain-containing protein [Myxococcales bacterium]